MYAHPLALKSPLVPVLLQPAPVAPRTETRRQKILVPVDGSPSADVALAHVIALARAMPVSVHLVNVQPPVMAGDINLFTTVKMVEEHRRAAGERALKRARSVLASAGIEHTWEIAFGSPPGSIVSSASVNGATKIVMTTRNKRFLAALLRPSVARRVVKLAPMAVTVLKAGAPPGARAESNFEPKRPTGALCSWRKRSCAPDRAYQGA